MKRKNRIIEAQEQYLKTQDQSKLVLIYEGLKALGLTIQENEPSVNQDPETVLDIASNVIVRLMETQQTVIRSAPSAYMKTALFYSNKGLFHDSIDDVADSILVEASKEDYQLYIEKLLDGIEFNDREVEDLVRATMDAGVDWHLVQRSLTDQRLRKDYSDKMREIKAYAKDHLQGNGVLSAS